jgi:hypothetical protein
MRPKELGLGVTRSKPQTFGVKWKSNPHRTVTDLVSTFEKLRIKDRPEGLFLSPEWA